MSIQFNQRVKHGRLDFHPGVAYGFEDPDAAPYFIAAGWASDCGDTPAAVIISLAEIDIDPLTRVAGTGQFVLPEAAEAHLVAHDGAPPPAPHEAQFQSGLIAPAPEA